MADTVIPRTRDDTRLTPAQLAWRDEVRAFLAENVTPALVEQTHGVEFEEPGPELVKFRAAVGAKGWFGITWPAEYGGLGLGAVEQHILMDEFAYARVPALDLTVASIAPMIMKYGTEQNRRDWLPGIADGTVTFAVGYSEPDAGTDLASLRTRAVRDGDEWVINGRKAWNCQANIATHEWLLVRTGPEDSRHRGLSIIVVPLDTPGIEVRPVYTWGGIRANETTFTDVRVPVTHLIGEVNRGWEYVLGALDLERAVISTAGDLRRALDDLIALCRQPDAEGRRLVDDPIVALRLAELDADVEQARLFCFAAAALMDQGRSPTIVATEGKIFGSELRTRLADVGMEILGMAGRLRYPDAAAPLAGMFERMYRFAPVQRFAGGTNEVLRDVVAQRGLGLPGYGRSARS